MCNCGTCKDCSPAAWMEQRRMEVGKIEFQENNLPGVFQPKEFGPPAPPLLPMFGASLRDQIAMAALIGIMSNHKVDIFVTGAVDKISIDAYKTADAMLAAREK